MNRRSAIKAMVVAPVAMALPGEAADESPKPRRMMWKGGPGVVIKKTLIIDEKDYHPNAMFAWMYIPPGDLSGRSRQDFEAKLDVELRGLKHDILHAAEQEYGLGKETT